MATISVKFNFKAETAGSVRYEEIDAKGKALTTKDDACVIGALYLRKAQLAKLGKKAPKTITVTVEGSGAVDTEPARVRKVAAGDEKASKKVAAKKSAAKEEAPAAKKALKKVAKKK